MLLGYARVSTADQTTTPQEEALRAAGCKRIYTDTASGARTARPGLDGLLDAAREGDTVVVWRLDRLGRSLAHLLRTVADLESQGKGFRSLTEQIDTGSPAGRLVFHIFASLAQFERELLHERIKAGIASARARGHTGGRPRALDPKQAKLAARLMGDRDRNVAEVCRTLAVSRSTLYRLVRQQAAEEPAPAAPAAKPPRKASKPAQAASKPKSAKPPTKGTKTTTNKRKWS